MSNTTAFSFEQISHSNKPQKFDERLFASNEGVAEKAFITSEGNWRIRYDGGDPSVTEGHLLRDGSAFILHGELQIRKFRAISLTDDSVLSISFERK